MKSSVRIATVVASILGTLPIAHFAMAGDADTTTTSASDDSTLQEVVVTSQRREEKITDVPLSISAYTKDQMDAQGVRDIDDIASLTPGITFQRADARTQANSAISIRGISSGVGASTTGIYIDDTPVQVRQLGAGAGAYNVFPEVFDLDRVEVLRGPQGTLFGAGSEGGTVRFITAQPNLTQASGYARTELGYTENGDPSYEAGVAYGAPIVDDTLGFRVSAWFRRDGGWVDRDNWDHTSTEAYPPVAPTPSSITFPNSVDSNWQDSAAIRGALTYKPTDNLTITPSIYYQKVKYNDTSAFWGSLSDPSSGDYVTGNAINSPTEDRFYLPSLKIDWAFSGVRLVSNTSYFNREGSSVNDYTAFETALWTQSFTIGTAHPYLNGPYYPAGYTPAENIMGNAQSNITEELRLQSDDPSGRISWVVGAFYTHNKQTATQLVSDPGLVGLISSATDGFLTLEEAFGQPLVDGKYTDVEDPVRSIDQQIALFGQADVKITDKLTFTAGVRVAEAKTDTTAHYEGPVVGAPVNDSGSATEHPVTPKASLTWKFDPDNMLYATAAKGFRIGGYNPRVGSPCVDDPNYPGYKKDYGSDSVWSYEVGSKNAVLDNHLQLQTSVYYINWKNIQQGISLNSCGFGYVANLGSANSRGADFQADWAPIRELLVSLSVGYTDAKFTETVKATSNASVNLVTDGDHIAGWPVTVAFATQYSFPILGHDGYARVDYQFQSRQSNLVAANDPLNGSYQADNVFVLPNVSQLGLRAGVRYSNGLDVSLFCKNLLDSHPVLSQSPSIALPISGELVDYDRTTLRPRTVGVTVTLHF